MLESAATWDWTWKDAAIFIGVFTALRIAVIWMATKAFIMIIPEADACPLCDAATSAVEHDGAWRFAPKRFRRSWCLECGWEGVLQRSSDVAGTTSRHGVASMANSASQSGQLPLSSKKSSK